MKQSKRNKPYLKPYTQKTITHLPTKDILAVVMWGNGALLSAVMKHLRHPVSRKLSMLRMNVCPSLKDGEMESVSE